MGGRFNAISKIHVVGAGWIMASYKNIGTLANSTTTFLSLLHHPIPKESSSSPSSSLGTYVVCNIYDGEYVQINNNIPVTAYAVQYPKIFTAHKQEIHIFDVTTNERESYKIDFSGVNSGGVTSLSTSEGNGNSANSSGISVTDEISCILVPSDYFGTIILVVGKKLVCWAVGEDSYVDVNIDEDSHFSPVCIQQ